MSILSRGVHGSVRFGLDLKNQPNRITVICKILTEPDRKPVQTEPVRFG
jgi:hypothetical protein